MKSLEWKLRRVYENPGIEYKMYIKRNDFETLDKLEDLGKEWESELAKLKTRGPVLQITEPRIENKNDQKHNIGNNHSDNTQNGRQQYTPRALLVQQRYGIPQYQTPSLRRPSLYPAFRNTPQPGFCKDSNLDFEMTNIDISTTLIIK